MTKTNEQSIIGDFKEEGECIVCGRNPCTCTLVYPKRQNIIPVLSFIVNRKQHNETPSGSYYRIFAHCSQENISIEFNVKDGMPYSIGTVLNLTISNET